jgi:hypothetical protein
MAEKGKGKGKKKGRNESLNTSSTILRKGNVKEEGET